MTEVTVYGAAVGFVQRIETGRHTLAGDEPARVGGTDQGPSPYEFLLAALGACTAATLRMYADRKKWPLEDIEVHVTHEKEYATDCADCDTREVRVDKVERRLRLFGPLDDEQRARLLEIAERCPVHRTLTSETRIETVLAD